MKQLRRDLEDFGADQDSEYFTIDKIRAADLVNQLQREDGKDFELGSKSLSELKHVIELITDLIDHPEGCLCPNNGGGDCEWCQLRDSIKAYL